MHKRMNSRFDKITNAHHLREDIYTVGNYYLKIGRGSGGDYENKDRIKK